MRVLFGHVGNVLEGDSFDQAVGKIQAKLKERTNKIVQRNMLLSNYPQGTKSFEKWSQEISEAAKLIDYDNYDWKQAAVDAMLLQTTSLKLREKALSENVTYDELLKIGITKEQSEKGAALLEQASGHTAPRDLDEEVRRLKIENRQLKKDVELKEVPSDNPCNRCGLPNCPQNKSCSANGKQCS